MSYFGGYVGYRGPTRSLIGDYNVQQINSPSYGCKFMAPVQLRPSQSVPISPPPSVIAQGTTTRFGPSRGFYKSRLFAPFF